MVHSKIRPEVLNESPLHYAPENELGVVFLFANLLKKYRLRVDQIQSSYPDCIAYQKVGNMEKRIRIEFEFKSRNFKTHRHNPNNCDWVVCWEHNWPTIPKRLNVVELRKEFGLGFNVWVQPISVKFFNFLTKVKNKSSGYWSVPSIAHKGDLLLYYYTSPASYIKDIFIIGSNVEKINAKWKQGKDYMAKIVRISSLKSPVFLDDMKRDKILKTANFVRNNMQGRNRVTEYWPYLYNLIIKRNPNSIKSLYKYSPERL